MIALDTSSLIAYLSGESGDDVELVAAALADKTAVLPPVVLAELLSDPALDETVAGLFGTLPLLGLGDGFWERAGRRRAKVIRAKKRARLADSLIAQSCVDHRVALVTRDLDFRHFVGAGGLKLLP